MSNFKTYDEFLPIFFKLKETFEARIEDFNDVLWEQKEEINKACDLFGFFGVSRNEDFNGFLDNFESFILAISNMLFGVDKTNDELTRRRQIARYFHDAEAAVKDIEDKRMSWRKEIGVSEKDYNDIMPMQKEQYEFRQSIPISSTALVVDFDVEFKVLPDRTIHVTGGTNLYDKASLMLTIRGEGRIIGQSKARVEDGMFDFGVFTIQGSGYAPGNYVGEVSVSMPHTQPKEFVDKAGIEYENLTGPYLDRGGVGGPTIVCDVSFTVG